MIIWILLIRNQWEYCNYQNKRLNYPGSGNCKLTIANTNGPFLIIVCGGMKDAIVWKWWIWDPCWRKSQRSSYAKVLFSLAPFPLYSIVWQLSPCTSATCQCSWYCATIWYRLQSITQQPAASDGAPFAGWQRMFYHLCPLKKKHLLNCMAASYC